jgi:hypothetical protein
MQISNLDARIFITEPPEIEFKDGMFHLRQKISDHCVIERVMSPHVFSKSVRAGQRALALWRGGATVIEFSPCPAVEGAAPATH